MSVAKFASLSYMCVCVGFVPAQIKAAVKLECGHPWNFLSAWCVSEAVCVA